MEITTDVNRQDFHIKSAECKKEFLRNLVVYYIVCEGTFFFSGFAMLLALGRQNKLPGLSDQIKIHSQGRKSPHPIWYVPDQHNKKSSTLLYGTHKFENETIGYIKRAVELEVAYAHDVLPRGILGLNAEMFCGIHALYWEQKTRRNWDRF